jgi:hypothetical protein
LAVLMAIAMLPAAADELGRFIGEWRGESICAAKNTACHDETVIYRITKLRGKSGYASVSADKIVSGNAVNMGTLEFRHEQNALICEYSEGVWRLKFDGGTIECALIRPDNTIFRRVTLRKEP